MNNKEETIIDPRVYEVAYILVPTMKDVDAENKANSIKESIAAMGGSFISEEAPYMRELAYEMTTVIKNVNTRFTEGYFGWIKFEVVPSVINEFDKKLSLDEDIIRFITVKADRDVNIYTKKISTKSKELVSDESQEEVVEDVVAEASSEEEVKELN